MMKAARSLQFFSGYLIANGITLLLFPGVVLRQFFAGATATEWPRLTGVLLLLLAYYYIQAARAKLMAFIAWTVYARLAVFVSFLLLVLFKLARPILLLFGLIDLLGAIWTAVALRNCGSTRH